jgi:hypothetical protein
MDLGTEENYYLPDYSDDDVLAFNGNLVKVGKFRDLVKFAFNDPNQISDKIFELLRGNGVYINPKDAFGNGLNGEVLKIGAKGWQKGKLRIKVSLEFYPDEPEISQPESPLDDLRQMINQENQQ